ncbi:MAG TPA: peptide-methionine (S)-S-oxide reductase, partial [Nitratifractor sp.]|nr:peptide-methionine (S)-S-oxide reductase [Nitratifractor sp.]
MGQKQGAYMRYLILALFLVVSLQAKKQTIVFAGGCFWGVEKHFEKIKGVTDAQSGYAGGNYPNPTYHKVLSYRYDTPKGVKNYTESVKVVYDDSVVSSAELIKSFWEMHDPTQKNRQGNDRGNNYRSAIFYTTSGQKADALKTKAEYQKLLSKAGYGKIVTQIEPLDKFYPAEQYHQDYLKKNPKGYCPNHATGVKFSADAAKAITPLGGKEIVVVDAADCPFCEKLKKDVLSSYKGAVPLRTARANTLKGFKIKTKLDATPIILFIQDGKELFAIRGYVPPKTFYKALGYFKL